MKQYFWKRLFLVIPMFALVLVACASPAPAAEPSAVVAATEPPAATETPTKLIVSLDASPPHLDVMSNTTAEVVIPSNHIFETLFGWDAGYKPSPMLVDTYQSDAEGKTWSFTLRKGVKFHNGKEMKVEDVKACFERWLTTSNIAKGWTDVTFEAVDDYSFKLASASTRATLLSDLANTSQALAIMPKEIVTGVKANELTQYIGTGPFMFDSLVPDQYVRLKAFTEYSSRDEPQSGFVGGKKALVDELEFRIIKDVPTRTAALRAGEIHVIPYGVPGADRTVLQADTNVTVALIKGNQKWGPIFNHKSKLGGNQKLRQAIAAAIDAEEIALAITGDESLYEVTPSLSAAGTFYYSEVSAAKFNQADAEVAKQLLKESGYSGEEMVIISTKANIFQDKMAVVMQAQLEYIGMEMRIDWYDGATIREVRTQPDKWDIIPGGWGTTNDPGIYAQAFACASKSWSGSCDPSLDAIFDKAKSTIDLNERKKVYEELQTKMIEETVNQILLGDFHALRAYRSNVKGVQEFKDFTAWNVSVE